MHAACTSVGVRIDMLDNEAWRGNDTPSERKVEGEFVEVIEAASCLRGFVAIREKLKREGWGVLRGSSSKSTSSSSSKPASPFSSPSVSASLLSSSDSLSDHVASSPPPSSTTNVLRIRFRAGTPWLRIKSPVVNVLRFSPPICDTKFS